MGSKYKKEELERLMLVENKSYEEVGRMFNCTGSNIRKICRRFEINVPNKRIINPKEHFNKNKVKNKQKCLNCNSQFVSYATSEGKYCSRSCFTIHKKKVKYEHYLANPHLFENKIVRMRWIKPIILKEQNCKCAVCKMKNEWESEKLVFILDHIDGNAANNLRDNLRLVCPNCDSQLPTYKSKNKNSARTYRYT
jgi:hypothetical protein